MRGLSRYACLAALMWIGLSLPCRSAELPEYELKAAFLYNFAQFTEWPPTVGAHLNLCTYGGDPFGDHLDELKDKQVGERTLQLRRRVTLEGVGDCHILYVAPEAIDALSVLRGRLIGRAALVVTDSPGAARLGATINMTVAQKRVSFEVNRRVERAAGLDISSRLLRLATQVIE